MSGPGARMPVGAPQHKGPTVSLINAADLQGPLGAQADVGQPTGTTPGWGGETGELPAGADPLSGAIAIPRSAHAVRWLNGITYEPEKCSGGGTKFLGGIAGGAVPAQSKTLEANASAVTSDPFLVYAGDSCSTMGWEARDYVGRARRLLDANEARLVEAEFWDGTASKAAVTAGLDYTATQYLAQSTTVTILGDGTSGQGVLATWALLLDALGDCAGGGPGMIHITRSTLPWLRNDVQLKRDGGKLVDELDNIIVPGSGYSGKSPAGASPASGKQWVYATGLVRIWRDEVLTLPGSYEEALDRATNSITFRAERAVLVDWDRCCHFAALMTLA